jgi:hypothetical protein
MGSGQKPVRANNYLPHINAVVVKNVISWAIQT